MELHVVADVFGGCLSVESKVGVADLLQLIGKVSDQSLVLVSLGLIWLECFQGVVAYLIENL